MRKRYPGVTPLTTKERERPPWRTRPAPDQTKSVDAVEVTGQATLSHALNASLSILGASPFVFKASPSALKTSDRRTVILEQLG